MNTNLIFKITLFFCLVYYFNYYFRKNEQFTLKTPKK